MTGMVAVVRDDEERERESFARELAPHARMKPSEIYRTRGLGSHFGPAVTHQNRLDQLPVVPSLASFAMDNFLTGLKAGGHTGGCRERECIVYT